MPRATINGKKGEFKEGITILAAAHALKIEIPTLCHDERLKPSGGCRLCVVEVKGWPHPVTACTTPLTEGMEVATHSGELEERRRGLLRLLARRYPPEPFRRFPEKEFHRYIRDYGLEAELGGESDPALVDDSHPYIRVDMSRCVYCFRCVRICEELQGQFVWHAVNRGESTRIVTDSGDTLLESACVGCGACVDSCPSGALEDQFLLAHGLPTSWQRTVCGYCGTGCEMNVGVRKGRIVAVRPVLDAPVSKGHLCVKGRYAFDFVHAEDRVLEPMIREGGRWRRVSWGEAIGFAASGLERLVERHGPRSVGVLGSARGSNEENYLAQKFARVVLGTNNVDCCARVCHAPSAAGMKLVLGTGAATNSLDDIEQAAAILVCGANPTENHPIVGARIKQRALGGAGLIVIDPREIELARYASVHLQLRPGTNVALLNAMACAIVEEGLCDEAFLKERVSQFEEFRDFIRDFSPEQVEPLCGVRADLIREAARLYAMERPAMSFHGLGLTEHTQGTDGVICLVNLALLTGNVGRAGSGINPLRGQNNVQGSAHMGCEPDHLTGYLPLGEGGELFESMWRVSLPSQKGLNLMEMMDEAEAGRLKGLWAIGYDLLLTNPNAAATRRALERLELVIIQDMFLNETAREFGSVFFPAASMFEKDGTFMNGERRVQRLRKVVEPPGDSKPDWEIVCALARALGKGEFFEFDSPRTIWDEIRRVWKAGSGITYERLEQGGLQWPCPSEDHPGTQILHGESFPSGRRAALRRVEYRATGERATKDFPFLLVTGRSLYQFNAGTMTGRTKNSRLRPKDLLDISPLDAERLGLSEGEGVRLMSRYGETRMTVSIHPGLRPGDLFATFQTPEIFLNAVTGSGRDNRVQTPEYKVTAVRIDKM